MSYIKQNFQDGNVLSASQLNHMETGIEDAHSAAQTASNNAVTANNTAQAASISASNAAMQAQTALNTADNKQDKLVSGVNIKTINGQDLLGEGDITVEGGGGSADLTGYLTKDEADDTYATKIDTYTKSEVDNKIKEAGAGNGNIVVDGAGNKELKILFIGNSLTQDAVSYLPLLLDEIAPEIKYTIYDWYNGGNTLEQQYSKFTNNTPCENFGTITNNQAGGWTCERNTVTMNWICQNCDFDIVVIQEYSYYDFTDSVEVTNFNNVVNYLRTNYHKPFKVFSFVDAPMRTRVESDYAKAKRYAKMHVVNSVSEGIVNAGTAVVYGLQDALLKNLGDKGQLSADGTHTQEGLPCLLQSYVLALWVFDLLGVPKSVLNSKTEMTQEFYDQWQTFGANLGSGVVEGTPAQYRRAQEIAITSYKYGKQLLSGFLFALADDSDDLPNTGGDAGAITTEVYKPDSCISTSIAVGSACTFFGNQYTVTYDVYKVPIDANRKYTVRVTHGLQSDSGNMPVIAVCNSEDIVVGIIKASLNSQEVREEVYVIDMTEYEDASYILATVYEEGLSVSLGGEQVNVTVAHTGAMIRNSTLAVGSPYEPSASQYTTDYNIYKTSSVEKTCSLLIKHSFYSSTSTNTPIILVCDSSDNVLEIIRTSTNVQKERIETYLVDMSQYAKGSYIVFNALGNEYNLAVVE